MEGRQIYPLKVYSANQLN